MIMTRRHADRTMQTRKRRLSEREAAIAGTAESVGVAMALLA
jgi:hypothetical protein